jgi:hypothetical protein
MAAAIFVATQSAETGAGPAPVAGSRPPAVEASPPAAPARERDAATQTRTPAAAEEEPAEWWSPNVVKTGRHFTVTTDCASDAVAAAVLDAAEWAWPATTRLVGGLGGRPEARLELRLIRSRSAYRAPDAAKLFTGRLKTAAGWADYAESTAYVLLDACEFDDAAAERFGPCSAVMGAAVHESAHLVASLCLPTSGGCPWFDEGIATRVEEEYAALHAPDADVSATTHLGAELAVCRRLRANGTLPDVRGILRGGVDRLGDFDDHAVAWAFLRILDAPGERDRTAMLFAAARRLPDGAAFTRGLETNVLAIWGSAGVDALDKELLRTVDAFAPQWDASLSHSIDVEGPRWLQVARPGRSVYAWRTEPAGRADYRITGTFEIVPGGSERLAVYLGRTAQGGGVGVAFGAGEGVRVFAWNSTAESAKTLAFQHDHRPAAARTTYFEIRVLGGELTVSLDGAEITSAPLAGRDVSGQWGVAAQDGSTGVWKNVRIQ